MKQNNTVRTLKATIAVVLVMASLFTMSSLVSAGFVKEVFAEVEMMLTSSDSSECEHDDRVYVRTDTQKCNYCSGEIFTKVFDCPRCGIFKVKEPHHCEKS